MPPLMLQEPIPITTAGFGICLYILWALFIDFSVWYPDIIRQSACLGEETGIIPKRSTSHLLPTIGSISVNPHELNQLNIHTLFMSLFIF